MDDFTVSATSADGPDASADEGSDRLVRVTGDVDSVTAHRLRSAVAPLLGPGAKVTLDCAGIRFLDSAGLRVLLELHRTAQDEDGQLVLAAPPAVVERVLELSGVTELFTILPGFD